MREEGIAADGEAAAAEEAADPHAGMPVVVRVLAFLMVSQLFCGFWLFGLGMVMGTPGGLLRDPIVRISIAALVWQMGVAGLLVRPLLRRSLTAWAAVQGVLVIAAASSAALAILSLTVRSVPLATGDAMRIGGSQAVARCAIEVGLAVWLYRSRGWFGPEAQWRTVWARGWWAILVTALLSTAYLAALVERASRSFSPGRVSGVSTAIKSMMTITAHSRERPGAGSSGYN